MSITANFVDQWSDGKRVHGIGTLSFAGNYVEGGVPLDLSAYEIGGPPLTFLAPDIGQDPYTFAYLPGSNATNGRLIVMQMGALPATGTITSNATNVSDGDTVTVGATTYTFKLSVASTANQVLIGVSAADSLKNLSYAINNDPSKAGKFGSATVANLTEYAGIPTATVLTVIARKGGTGANGDALSKVAATLTVSGATLAGGAALSTTAQGEIATGAAFPADLQVLTPPFYFIGNQLSQLG